MDVLDVNLMRYDMQKMMTKEINGSADIATRNNERLSTVENDGAAIVHSIASVTISMNGLFGSMKKVKGVLDVVADVVNPPGRVAGGGVGVVALPVCIRGCNAI